MSKEATEFFRKERLAKRVKEQNKALNQELERVKGVALNVCEKWDNASFDYSPSFHIMDDEMIKLRKITNNQ